MKMCWKIQPANVPANSRVKLWFTRWDIEEGYDFIRVWDLVGNKLLHDDMPKDAMLFSKQGFLVNFVTDADGTAKGFNMSFAVGEHCMCVTHFMACRIGES